MSNTNEARAMGHKSQRLFPVSEDEASKLIDYINDKFPSVDAELQYGGQPIYYYIISAE